VEAEPPPPPQPTSRMHNMTMNNMNAEKKTAGERNVLRRGPTGDSNANERESRNRESQTS